MNPVWRITKYVPARFRVAIKRVTGDGVWLWARKKLGGSEDSIPDCVVTVADGRRFHIGPDYVYLPLYLGDEFEPIATSVLRRIIQPGDTIVDAGANYGWYTTLASRIVGDDGRVFAFEPVPTTHCRLREHLQLNNCEKNVSPQEFALGEQEGEATIHIFDKLSHARSSLADLGEGGFDAYTVPVWTLDSFLDSQGVNRVDFLKCDVEGSELHVFKGAQYLLRSSDAPIVLVELNDQTSRAFDYSPADLWHLLCDFGYDHFYQMPAIGKVEPLKNLREIKRCNLLLACKGDAVERRAQTAPPLLKKSA